MRCQKCQYVGFEPSPRCKNCGYDFSLGSDDLEGSDDRPGDTGPMLTLDTEPEFAGPMADFDLQIFDDVAARRVQSGAKPFDLDDLLANGPASGSLSSQSYREAEPVIAAVSAVAKQKQSRSASMSASAVATPPAMEIEALFKPEPVRVTEPEPLLEPVVEVFVESVEPVVTLTIEPEPMPAPRIAKPAPAPVTTELPLFMQGMAEISERPAPAELQAEPVQEVDDRPLVQMPASPRAPLAVRRTTPDPARLRAKYARAAARAKTDELEMSGDLLNDAHTLETSLEPRIIPPAQRLSSEPTPTSLPAEWLQGAGPVKRLTAALLDSALLLSLNAAVIWFTLSVCGLAPAQANLLPVVPLLLFFLLLDAGYLVLFTAACGQTIGKMAAGIRVVGTSTGAVINDRITIAQALMRSLGSIVSMLPLGAGFWFGLVGDRRAVHDRLAHTRVVSA